MNKLCTITILFFLLSTNFLFAKKNNVPKPYHITIYVEHHHKLKGLLYEISDSSIVIANKKHNRTVFDTVSYRRIIKFRLVKTGSGRDGFILGASLGLGFGIYKAIQVDYQPAALPNFEKFLALSGGILLAIPLGFICSSVARNTEDPFYVRGDLNLFQLAKTALADKVVYHSLP